MDDINENVGLTNEIKPYSMLIDVVKEMTNHSESHYTEDDINEIRVYLNIKIVEAKKRSAENLNLSNIEGSGEFIYFSYLTFQKINKNPRHKALLMILIIILI